MDNAVNYNPPKHTAAANSTRNERYAARHSSNFSAPAQHQSPFNANILQQLLSLIQQLVQLLNKSQQQPPQNPPENKSLELNDDTRAKLAERTGAQADSIRVTDRDGDGELSAGDLVEGSKGSGAESVRYELNGSALRDLNGELGPELSLSSQSNAVLNKVLQNQTAVPLTAFDNDNDGRISAGDVLVDRSGNYSELTTANVKKFENESYGAELNLSSDELGQVNRALYANQRFDIPVGSSPPPWVSRAFDSDGDGKLSAGDTLEFKSNPPRGVPLPPDFKPQFSYAPAEQGLLDRIDLFASESPPVVTNQPVGAEGASIGSSLTGDPISNDKVVNINGQDYTVGFLKQQADAYANADPNSFDFTPPDAEAQVVVQRDWGTGSTGSRAERFEAYISQFFPNGEPNL